MKKLYFLFLWTLTLSATAFGQTTLYSENFTGQNGKGATRGVFGGTNTDLSDVTWSIDISSASLDGSGILGNGDYFAVVNEAFAGKDTDGNAIWYSPSIPISGYSNVSFSLGMTSSGNCDNNDSFTTQYRLNGAGAWINAATNGAITNDPSGNAATVSQTGISGSIIQVRVIISTNADDDIYTFDNVLITGLCTNPSNVSALTATAASQQVTLNWNNSVCYDEYLVVARAGNAVTATPTGNGSAYTANAAFGSGTQIAANEFVVYKGTGTAVNVTALTNNLVYHFRVYTRKGTNWSTGVPVSATPALTYCTPPSSPVQYGTSIRAVSFGNTPYAPTPEKISFIDPRYQDYTAQSTTVEKGTNSNLSVQIDTDGNFNVYTYAWIDWNQNGVFTDPGETYDLGNTFNANPGPTANSPLSVAIPVGAVTGPTRMRVLCQYYGGSIPTNGPCDGATDGEVEDYTVNVIPPITYVYNNGWSPSNPMGVSTSANNIVIANGTAIFTANTQSNTIVVNPTGAISVNSGVTLSSANGLTLQSNDTQYSSLILDGTITGTVSYNRHVNGYPSVGVGSGANDLIAPPVSGQTFSAFAAANNNLYENPANPSQKRFGPFSKASGTYVNWDTNTNGSGVFTAGVGYRAASNNNAGFVFSGTPNNGVVTHNIVNSGPQFAAYNLIGNPYPSYINVREFLEYDVEPGTPVVRNIDLMDTYGAIYGYDGDASGTGSNGWTVYNLTTPTTVNITPGQGFLVTADAADVAAYDMTFTPAMRRIGNTDDFIPGRLADENNAHIKLLASMGTSSLTTDIFFNQASTSGLDFGYDAAVFGSNAASKAIYSQLVENNTGTDLAIQSLAYDAMGTDISIPLGINVPQGQQVTVSIAESSLPANMEVYLEDSLEGTFTLLNSADYTFTPNTNLTDTGRFFLRFADATLSSPEAQLATVQIYATSNPRALFVKGQLAEKSTLQVYDIQGRVVMTGSLEGNSNSNQLDVSALSSGPYIVVLNNSTQQKTQKIILR